MKRALAVLFAAFAGVGQVAAVPPPAPPAPQEVARQLVAAFQSGRAAAIQSKLAADRPVLEQGVRTFPQDPFIHFALAICQMGQGGQSAAAADNLKSAYALSHKNLSVGLIYALALKNNRQPQAACQVAGEMAALHPDIPQVQIGLATLDMAVQKYAEAITVLETLQRRMPASFRDADRSELAFMLGTCHLYAGEPAKAIAALNQSLALTPRQAPVLAVLGEAWLKTGESAKAVVALDQVLAINPDHPAALYHRGLCYEQAGNPAAAQKCFQAGYGKEKPRLQEQGEDYYLMYLLCQKTGQAAEGEQCRAAAARLGFSFAAPWQKRQK